MKSFQVAAATRIWASAPRVYAIIADYRAGHPRILPPAFQDLEVEEGGVGAGTKIRFKVHLLGVTRTARAVVSEPQPGRVLVESYPDTGAETTFTVWPTAHGHECNVEIMSRFPQRGGVLGLLERSLVRATLRRVYAQELALLAKEVGVAGAVSY